MTAATTTDTEPNSGVDLAEEVQAEPNPLDRLWMPAPADWYTTAPPARRWLFRDGRQPDAPGVFPLGKAGQLVAAGGVGKTMSLVSLARAVTLGSPWLGTFPCSEPGPVALVLGEEDAEEAHRRIYNEARRSGAPPAGSIVVVPLAGVNCALLGRDTCGNPVETPFAAWLRERIAASGIDFRLIVVDPMSRFAGLEAEKDNAIGTRYVQICESLTTPTRSVLSSHHTPQSARGKGATEAPRGRGVTAAFDGFRWEAALASEDVAGADEHLREIVRLTFTKSNYSKKPEPLLLRRGDYGALLPLDETDRELLAEAKASASERPRQEAKTRKQQAEIAADVSAITKYVVEHPGCSVRAARAAAVRDNAGRWLRAVDAMGEDLRANGGPMSTLEHGKPGRLTFHGEASE